MSIRHNWHNKHNKIIIKKIIRESSFYVENKELKSLLLLSYAVKL